MKKLLLIIIALLAFSCIAFADTQSDNTGIFGKEVSNLKAISEVGKVKLSWLVNDFTEVDKIEIYKAAMDSNEFEKVKEVSKETTVTDIELPALVSTKICVKLVSNNGSVSIGKIIEVMAKHKNIILDKVQGRQLAIYLPDGYDSEKNKRYPVVYMHDGQNLFLPQLSGSGNEWGVDETVDKLIREEKIEKLIVVGIYNSNEREKEYTAYFSRGDNGGYAKEFSQFVVKKIVPYIDNKYRTIKNRENRAVMGSSFGGVLSFYMAYNYPAVFSMAGAISPSFWYDDNEMNKEALRGPKKNVRLWIDIGDGEGSMVTDARMMVDSLLQKGYIYGKDLAYYEVKGAAHDEQSWADRIKYPFIFFKGKKSQKLTNLTVELISGRNEYLLGTGETFFNNINAVADFDNGLRYSLYNLAGYKIIDNNGVMISNTGSLSLNAAKKIQVKVKYNNLEKEADFEIKDF